MAGQKWICTFTPLGLLLLSLFVHYSEASITTEQADQCNKFDLNNNGVVSLEEAEEILQKPPFNFLVANILIAFKKYDLNIDSELDKAELPGFCSDVYSATPVVKEPQLDQCDQFDLNNDGVVSIEEAEEKMRQPPFSLHIAKILMLFSMYDLDNNWKLAHDELLLFCSFVREKAHPCNKFDLNNDGIISFEEAEELLQKPPFNFPYLKILIVFKKYDSDDDNAVDEKKIADFCSDAYSAIPVVIKPQLDLCDQFDLNNDGVVSIEEAEEKLRQPPFSLPIAEILILFSKYDLDHNWKLAHEELFPFCLFAQPPKLLSDYLTANFIGWAPQVGSQLATLPVGTS